MELPLIYYESKKLKIEYSPNNDWYILDIEENVDGTPSFPIIVDSRAMKEFYVKRPLTDLVSKLNAYDERILKKLDQKGIFPSDLQVAFLKVKEKENKELKEFRKANNL